MVSGQTPKTKLPFFGELLAVIHSFVVELLAEPHTMIKTITERTGRPHVSYSIRDYNSIEILLPTKIWVLRALGGLTYLRVFGSIPLAISAASTRNLTSSLSQSLKAVTDFSLVH